MLLVKGTPVMTLSYSWQQVEQGVFTLLKGTAGEEMATQ